MACSKLAKTPTSAVLVAMIIAASAATGNPQCNNEPEVMQCNVPYWCQLRVGAFPLSNADTDDCICWQLCQDALAQGEGSSCRYDSSDDTDGARWFRMTFDKADGDNNYRGTVFCDPWMASQGGGRRLAGSSEEAPVLVADNPAAVTMAPRKLMSV